MTRFFLLGLLCASLGCTQRDFLPPVLIAPHEILLVDAPSRSAILPPEEQNSAWLLDEAGTVFWRFERPVDELGERLSNEIIASLEITFDEETAEDAGCGRCLVKLDRDPMLLMPGDSCPLASSALISPLFDTDSDEPTRTPRLNRPGPCPFEARDPSPACQGFGLTYWAGCRDHSGDIPYVAVISDIRETRTVPVEETETHWLVRRDGLVKILRGGRKESAEACLEDLQCDGPVLAAIRGPNPDSIFLAIDAGDTVGFRTLSASGGCEPQSLDQPILELSAMARVGASLLLNTAEGILRVSKGHVRPLEIAWSNARPLVDVPSGIGKWKSVSEVGGVTWIGNYADTLLRVTDRTAKLYTYDQLGPSLAGGHLRTIRAFAPDLVVLIVTSSWYPTSLWELFGRGAVREGCDEEFCLRRFPPHPVLDDNEWVSRVLGSRERMSLHLLSGSVRQIGDPNPPHELVNSNGFSIQNLDGTRVIGADRAGRIQQLRCATQ